jgi:hypothetical protein
MRPILSAALAIALGSLVLAQDGDRKPIKDSQLRVEAEIQKLEGKMAELIARRTRSTTPRSSRKASRSCGRTASASTSAR